MALGREGWANRVKGHQCHKLTSVKPLCCLHVQVKDTYGEKLDLKGYSDRSETRLVAVITQRAFRNQVSCRNHMKGYLDHSETRLVAVITQRVSQTIQS